MPSKATEPSRFMNVGDLHYGWEYRQGRAVPMHNMAAIRSMIEFAADFQPHTFRIMGDGLNCGPISHWNKTKKLSNENLRMADEYAGFLRDVLDPLDKALPKACRKEYLEGNHEDWVNQALENDPELKGLIEIPINLRLAERGWHWLPLGTVVRQGKWYGIHGHELSGGKHAVENAVKDYERSLRVWHNHTFGACTKSSAVDLNDIKTGVSVPGLCDRAPNYGRKGPNRWMHGFNFGWSWAGGYFTDFIMPITDRGFVWAGKHYGAAKKK